MVLKNYEDNQSSASPDTPTHCLSLSMSMWWSTIPEASQRSIIPQQNIFLHHHGLNAKTIVKKIRILSTTFILLSSLIWYNFFLDYYTLCLRIFVIRYQHMICVLLHNLVQHTGTPCCLETTTLRRVDLQGSQVVGTVSLCQSNQQHSASPE